MFDDAFESAQKALGEEGGNGGVPSDFQWRSSEHLDELIKSTFQPLSTAACTDQSMATALGILRAARAAGADPARFGTPGDNEHEWMARLAFAPPIGPAAGATAGKRDKEREKKN